MIVNTYKHIYIYMYLLMYHYVTLSILMPRISAELPGVPREAYGSSAGLSSSAAAGWIGGCRWIHWGESDLGSATRIGWGILFESVCLCHAQNAPNAQRFFLNIVSCNPLPFRHFYHVSCVVTTTHQESELVRLQWPLHCQRFDHSINTAASKSFKHLSKKCWNMFVSN